MERIGPVEDIRFIVLTQGKFAIVDPDDAPKLAQYKWYAALHKSNKSFYAVRGLYRNGKRVATILMHREVLGPPSDKEVDHQNRHTLDNRKRYLRVASRSNNCHNRIKYSNNQSGFKGVCAVGDKWRASIRKNGKLKHLGYFPNPEDAYEAYGVAAATLHGEFARME